MGRPESKERNDAIVRRYLNGERASDIAKLFDITPARVSQILKARNITTRRHRERHTA